MEIFKKIFSKIGKNKELGQEANVNLNDYKDFAKKGIFVFLIPNTTYQEILVALTKSFADKFGSIFYVSINRPAEKVSEVFRQNKIKTDKFLFVDSTDKDVKKELEYGKFAFISSPKYFENFNKELNQIIDREKMSCFIFDSLSTMLIYQDQNTIIRFMHDLIRKLTISDTTAVFTCLTNDINSILNKDISMFVDEVFDLSKEKEPKADYPNKTEEIERLEKELESVEKAVKSNLISNESYLKTKQRIEKKIGTLKK